MHLEIVCRTVWQPNLPTISTVEMTHLKPLSRIGVAFYKLFRNAISIFLLQRPLSAPTLLPDSDISLPVHVALLRCHRAPPPPDTVCGLGSFIRAYKVLGRVLPKCSHIIAPLESAIAGQQSGEHIQWTDTLRKQFRPAQTNLTAWKSPSLYHDHLINFGSFLMDQLANRVSGPPYTSPATRSFISLVSLVQNFKNVKSPGYHVKSKLLVLPQQLTTLARLSSNPPNKHVY